MFKWVFTLKYHANGIIACHKVSLVARGFNQPYDIIYIKTFFLVVRLKSICMLLSLIVNQEWSLNHLEVSNTFLYSDIEDQVFMKQALWYVA